MSIAQRAVAVLVACVAFGSGAPVSALTIDFDGLPNLTPVSAQFPGVMFSLPGGRSPMTYDATYATSAHNVLINDDNLSDFFGEVLTVTFLMPAIGVSFSLIGDDGPAEIEVMTATAPVQLLHHAWDHDHFTAETIDLSVYGAITGFSIVLNWDEFIVGQDLFAIDDLTYFAAPPPVTTPLPGAAPLLAGGLSLLGVFGGARRRRCGMFGSAG